MVRMRLLAAILLVLTSPTAAQEVLVRASLDSTSYRIGDWIDVRLIADMPSDLQALAPTPGDTLGAFEVLQVRAGDSSEAKGRRHSSWIVRLTTFDTGSVVIPPFTVHARRGSDTTLQVGSSEPIPLTISTVELGENAELKDIKPPLDAPWRFEDVLPYLLFLAFAGVAVLAYLLYRRYRAKGAAEPVADAPPVPAHERALMELKELESKRLWQQGRIKEYYSEVTEIIRRFFEGRFHLPALEMTSDEIVRELKNIPEGASILKETDRFFLAADLVKFAKYEPSMAEHDAELQMAYAIVRGLIPRPEPVEDLHARAR